MQTVESHIQISPSGLMDARNAALYLGCSESTVYNLKRFRKIRAVRLGKRLHYFKDDLDGYIRRQFK